jgi:hypothetical protein
MAERPAPFHTATASTMPTDQQQPAAVAMFPVPPGRCAFRPMARTTQPGRAYTIHSPAMPAPMNPSQARGEVLGASALLAARLVRATSARALLADSEAALRRLA